MRIYKTLRHPKVYNACQRILSIIAFGNKGIENFLRHSLGDTDGTVLDVGCGTGRYADIFGDRYTGIDYNEEYIDYARKNHKGNFFTASSSEIKKLNKKFDFVLSINTLHHLSDAEVKEAVRQMKDIAGKKILVIDPVYPAKWNFLGYLLFSLDRGEHTRTYGQLFSLLAGEGFFFVSDLKNSFPYRVCAFEYKIQTHES